MRNGEVIFLPSFSCLAEIFPESLFDLVPVLLDSRWHCHLPAPSVIVSIREVLPEETNHHGLKGCRRLTTGELPKCHLSAAACTSSRHFSGSSNPSASPLKGLILRRETKLTGRYCACAAYWFLSCCFEAMTSTRTDGRAGLFFFVEMRGKQIDETTVRASE